MPTYSYACTECGHAFDIYQSFTDDALTSCPQCQGALRKKFSAVGVVFKGSGFYRNDARSSASSHGSAKNGDGTKDSSKSAASNGSDSGSSAKTSTSGDSKPRSEGSKASSAAKASSSS